jgi:ABC-type lipoprotein release transport system permease subunit
MTRFQLVLRGLAFHWRTHLAVVLGVATAVSVLAGALLVGDSVRGSLRALVLERLGRTDQVVASANFFGEPLAGAIAGDPGFGDSFTGLAPLIVARGLVTGQENGRRAGQVAVYGVDDRFWTFHGAAPRGPQDREALISPALAAQIGAEEDTAILVRVQRPTDVPIESLHGRKDDLGRTIRLTVAGVLPREALGEFALEPQQGEVRAVFVPLSRLQQELEAPGRVNTLLVSTRAGAADDGALQRLVSKHTTLEDLGLRITVSAGAGAFSLEADAGLLDAPQAEAARQAASTAGMQAIPVLTYLANAMRVGGREVPYSLVTAIDLEAVAPGLAPITAGQADPIVLNRWAADDLKARAGDTLTLDYYVWEEPGRLVSRSSDFVVAGIVPVMPAHRDLAPTYPGISDSPTLEDWDPPFPVDLRRVRPVDEAYWEQYRTTPKAYVPLDAGQRLWQSRYGAMTSLRIASDAGDAPRVFAEALRATIDPLAAGLGVRDVRGDSLAASRGATDFGEYFVYFSFFLVVSALLLAALFFRLGVEGRVREVGLLRAVGFGPADVRRLFMSEGLLLSVVGSALGIAGALGYASLLMYALRTWWVDAVGTTALTLHVTAASLAIGALGGILAAAACIWWTLRSLNRISERSLLAGDVTAAPAAPSGSSAPGRIGQAAAIALAAMGLALLLAGAAEWIDPAGAFFGAGFALLAASLLAFLLVLRRRPRHLLDDRGWQPLSRLGFRNATYRPIRSVVSVAVIASATFILISVDAFRRDGHVAGSDPQSGLGGYALIVDTLLPVAHDPNTPEGREALNLFSLDESVRFEPFRLLPGDDASCLNLYEPRNPRIVAPRDAFVAEGRFAFADSLATTDEERANPWLLLHREETAVVPVIADANSMTYVLHRKLGEEIVLTRGGGEIRLRLVASLRDSIFQGELLMSESNFRRLFPEQEGYQLLLVDDVAPDRTAGIAEEIENALSDLGADATTTGDRLAQFHRVENTYLSTFQTLGGLGLLLGTVGLATVLLRNVMERRRELALLGAVGYRKTHFMTMILAENVLLLAGGLLIGAVCAGLAIAPAVAERGGRFPLTGGGAILLFAVFAAGLLSSVVAIRAATRAPLLSSLRSE